MCDTLSSIKITNKNILFASIGQDSPYPNLLQHSTIHSKIDWDHTLTREETRYIGYGKVLNILPYTIQDNYTRERCPTTLMSVVIENDILRAEFLPELGGRLWSLYHKKKQRELLYVNPIIQPVNLALRNAWFSGGVEWNVGMKGHSPFTCAPLFSQQVFMDDGTPVLRMYEWERKRQCSYVIEAYLPAHSEFLYVRVRIVNMCNEEIPMYWWSNIAVPETTMTRILTPAMEGYFCRYHSGNYSLTKTSLPYLSDLDISYPSQLTNVMDLFYDVSPNPRKWITALDIDGCGLLHLSTKQLIGRKLFVWGMSPGGRHWQEFLSEPHHPYIEIQAGLTPTQLECIPMEPFDTWQWQEAFGLVECDPYIIHGSNYRKAVAEVEERANKLLSQDTLEDELINRHINNRTAQMLTKGSGWAALEKIRRNSEKQPVFDIGVPFTNESIGDSQKDWISLLQESNFPCPSPSYVPTSYMVQPEWLKLMEQAVSDKASMNWYAWYHLGVMRYDNKDLSGARKAWVNSVNLAPNAWSLRCLGFMAFEDGNMAAAVDFYKQAIKLRIDRNLVIECAKSMIGNGEYNSWLALHATLPSELANSGRILYYKALAHVRLYQFLEAERILHAPLVIVDMREGEISLSELWYELVETKIAQAKGRALTSIEREHVAEKWKLPKYLDFRMNVD